MRLDFGFRQVRLTLNKMPIQFLAALAGIPFGIAEFYILRPGPLINSLALEKALIDGSILLVGTGFTGEVTLQGGDAAEEINQSSN